MHASWLEQCLLPSEGHFIVVGDLQNGYGVLPYLESRKDCVKVFMGDFLDSWETSPPHQVRFLETVLNMVERGEAIALLGNHETQYLGPIGMRTNAFNSTTAALIMPIKRRMEKLMRPFVYHEASRTLFTHAGLTHKLWEAYELDFETLPTMLHAWSLRMDSPFYFMGRSRGGADITGGPLWCDWHLEFEPVEGLSQVVGHTASFHQKAWKDGTRVGNLRAKGSSWNVDCLNRKDTFDMLVFDASNGMFTGHQVNK